MAMGVLQAVLLRTIGHALEDLPPLQINAMNGAVMEESSVITNAKMIITMTVTDAAQLALSNQVGHAQ